MRIRSVKLVNFRSHRSTDLRFSDGLVAIIGPNGSGKTSLLEAICYALFPDTIRLKRDELIRSGSNTMRVELEFESEGRLYKVIRETSRGDSPRARLLIFDGDRWKVIQTGQRDVTKSVGDIIGISKEVFTGAVYIKQGEISSLVDLQPHRRKELVGKLIGVDDLEEIYKTLLEPLTALKEERDKISGFLSAENPAEVLRGLEAKLGEVRSKIGSVEERIKYLEEELRINEERKKVLSDVRDKYIKLSSALEEKNNKIKEISSRELEIRSEIDRIDEMMRDINISLERRLSDAYERILELNYLLEEIKSKEGDLIKLENDERRANDLQQEISRLSTVDDEIKALEQEIERLKRRIDSLERDMEKARIARERSAKLEESIRRMEEELNSAIKDLTPLVGEISFQQRTEDIIGTLDVRSLKDLAENLSLQLSQLADVKRAVDDEIAKNKQKYEELSRLLEILSQAGAKCPVCGSSLTTDRTREIIKEKSLEMARLSKAMHERELISSNLERVMGALSSLIRTTEGRLPIIEKLMEDLRIALRELRDLEPLASSLQDMLLLRKSLESRLDELNRSLNTKKKERDEIIKKKAILDDLISSREERVTRIEELKKRLEELREKRKFIEKALIEELGTIPPLEKCRAAKENYLKYLEFLNKKESLQRLLDDLRRQKARLAEEIDRLREDIDGLSFDEDKFSEISNRIEHITKELNYLREERSKLTGVRSELLSRIEEYKARLNEYNKKRKKLERLNKAISALENIRSAFSKDGLQRVLRDRARPIIEYHTNRIFQEFGLPFDRIRITPDYELFLISNGREFSSDQISGGEKIAAALSLRLGIAMAKLGRSAELVLMDEPTVHLDEDRKMALLSALRSISIPQMIVVTHSEAFKSVADEVIELTKKDNITEIRS